MKIKYFILQLIVLLLFTSCHRNIQFKETSLEIIMVPEFKGCVFDAMTGKNLPSRIAIYNDSNNIVNTIFKHLPGFFTREDGTFNQRLLPGKYLVKVYHGIDYISQEIQIEISKDKGLNADIYLKPWYPLKDEGWVCGDGHDHLYTENWKYSTNNPDTTLLKKVRKICLGQGVDFVCAAQGWAGFNDSTWVRAYKQFSDQHFIISYGSEMPKYRTGHTWWLGQTSTRGYFMNAMDTTYENLYYQSDKDTSWSFSTIKFPFIPDVDVVQSFKEADNAVAIMPHPTSWWWQERGKIKKYTTNAASYLSFGLLAGKIWDGLVVMGYDHDHYYYQNLWFNVLNQGYRIPAVSELDGTGIGENEPFYYGSMRTYYHLKGEFSIKNVVEAVKRGETFVTSGPIIMANVDDNYKIGEIIRIDGLEHKLNINAYCSGDLEDYLSYVIVFRNGHIYKLWDIREQKPRVFKNSLAINEKDKAWYVVKVYGRKAWKKSDNIDVFKVCNNELTDDSLSSGGDIHDVAITSPFYFWAAGVSDPEPMVSAINVTITDPVTGINIKDVKIDIINNGKISETISAKNGKATFTMQINCILKISAKGYPVIYRGLYLDYKPHMDLIENIASGKWMKSYYKNRNFVAGQIPWEAFNFDETKKVLSNVEWKIDLIENERDNSWSIFDGFFVN
jgi:hypothetical protein